MEWLNKGEAIAAGCHADRQTLKEQKQWRNERKNRPAGCGSLFRDKGFEEFSDMTARMLAPGAQWVKVKRRHNY